MTVAVEVNGLVRLCDVYRHPLLDRRHIDVSAELDVSWLAILEVVVHCKHVVCVLNDVWVSFCT